MGIYDTITIEHESIPKKWRGIEFQTKELYKAMEYYKVTPTGKLYRKHEVLEFQFDPKSFLGCSCHVVSSKWLRKTDLDGSIEVHTVDNKRELVQFQLSFLKGVLTGVARVRREKKSS